MINFLKQRIKNPLTWLLAVLLFASGMAAEWAIDYFEDRQVLTEKHEGQYQFINPLLECEGSEKYISWELKTFKGKLFDLIEKEKEKKRVSDVSVYFRDLNDGPWFVINEEERFIPASLLKVPLMMGYLKKAESDPGFLATKIKFDRVPPPFNQFYEPEERMEYGKSYTIEDLLFRMIAYSDNYANHLLLTFDNKNIIGPAYKELDIPPPDEAGAYYALTVSQYATFFRILFNASYLNKEMSNKALKMLSYVDFPGGIRAGVPKDVPVAQKFGERGTEKGEKQLHDCGIVYYPNYPYLLCVMTTGNDFTSLDSVIANISRTTYEEVSQQMQYKRKD